MPTNPPLPDYLDAPAAEIGASEPSEFHNAWFFEQAARLMSGKYCVQQNGTRSWVGLTCAGLMADDLTPNDCIARWASDDFGKWSAIMMQVVFRLTDMGDGDDIPDLPHFIMDQSANGENRSAVLNVYQAMTATPAQLYRALVNAG